MDQVGNVLEQRGTRFPSGIVVIQPLDLVEYFTRLARIRTDFAFNDLVHDKLLDAVDYQRTGFWLLR
jgi:hypothetical protein